MTLLLPYTPARDVYRLLGISPAASTDEILAACRRLARAFHPDRNVSPRATQEMAVVNEVRRLLTDPEARAEYDVARLRWHRAAASPPEPMLDSWPPLHSVGRGARSAPRRYARAAWFGMRATLGALSPSRCRRCRMVTARDDAFCPACGDRLTPRI